MTQSYYATPSPAADDLLSEWRWLIGAGLTLWRVTLAGDVLLSDPANGAVHMLDVAAGTIERVAADTAEFDRRVVDPAFAERIFRTAMLAAAALAGVRPATGKCLSHRIPLVLGGSNEPANLEACDVSVHFSLAGQIHHRVRELPPGAKIGRVAIRDRDSG